MASEENLTFENLNMDPTAPDAELLLGIIREQAGKMTKRQREILATMYRKRDTADGELVYEHGCGFIGTDPVAARTVSALLRMCAIRSAGVEGKLERYVINETGILLLTKGRQPWKKEQSFK